MIVAGIMSGTSADGIDVAIVRIPNPPDAPLIHRVHHASQLHRDEWERNLPKPKLLALESFKFPSTLRAKLLAAMEGNPLTTADLAHLHWRLGELYADAVINTIARHPRHHVTLIGCHGQTVYHQGHAEKYLGTPLRCTLQLGEPAIIAARTDLPVISDFRPADMAVAGQGAPLVPIFDYAFFLHATRHRVLQNLGGIGNCTVIPAAAAPNQLFAFDTGPANMLVDACTAHLYNRPYDHNGAIASTGKIFQSVIDRLLRDKFFLAPPPKSAGREQFGRQYTATFIAACQRLQAQPQDILATATALTADSLHLACQRFIAPQLALINPNAPKDFILSGGGTQNPTLISMLQTRLKPLGFKVSTTDQHHLPSQSKEAAAFALLAWLTWHHRPGNIPTATGAARPTILGRITHA